MMPELIRSVGCAPLTKDAHATRMRSLARASARAAHFSGRKSPFGECFVLLRAEDLGNMGCRATHNTPQKTSGALVLLPLCHFAHAVSSTSGACSVMVRRDGPMFASTAMEVLALFGYDAPHRAAPAWVPRHTHRLAMSHTVSRRTSVSVVLPPASWTSKPTDVSTRPRASAGEERGRVTGDSLSRGGCRLRPPPPAAPRS